MPVPLLSTLTRAVRMAYPFVRRGVREGLSANSIIRQVREALGVAGRRQSMLRLISAERRVWERGGWLKYLPMSQTPRIDRLPFALTKLRRALSFVVEVQGRITGTDESILQYVTVSLSKPRTRAEIEQLAIESVEGDPKRYGIDVVGAKLFGGVQAGEAGTFR